VGARQWGQGGVNTSSRLLVLQRRRESYACRGSSAAVVISQPQPPVDGWACGCHPRGVAEDCRGAPLNRRGTHAQMKDTALFVNREIYKVRKADYAPVSDARPPVATIYKAIDLKVGKLPSTKVRERDWRGHPIPRVADKTSSGQLAQPTADICRRGRSCSPTSSHTGSGSATASSWTRARFLVSSGFSIRVSPRSCGAIGCTLKNVDEFEAFQKGTFFSARRCDRGAEPPAGQSRTTTHPLPKVSSRAPTRRSQRGCQTNERGHRAAPTRPME
jgi:hypothetical protein